MPIVKDDINIPVEIEFEQKINDLKKQIG